MGSGVRASPARTRTPISDEMSRDEISGELSHWTVLGLGLVFTAGLAFYFAITEGQGRLHHDMSEAYAWGREFRFGYHQHPPFWAWLCGLWFLIWPREFWAFGLLSAVNAAAGMLGAWAAIGEFARGPKRVAATALLLLTPCYSILAFKYNANIIFISLWPLTIFALMRALKTRALGESVLFGLCIGLMLLSKYFAGVLLLSCALAIWRDPRRRAYLRSASPYLSALVAGAVFAPHVAWLLTHQAQPIEYLVSQTGYGLNDMAGFLGRTLSGAATILALPTFVLLLFSSSTPREWIVNARAKWREPLFGGLAVLTLAPIVLSLAFALLLRTRIYTEMLVGVFPLAPLLMIEIAGVPDMRRFARVCGRLSIAACITGLVLATPVSIASVYVSARAADSTPDRELALEATRIWRDQTGTPLAYVAGVDGAAAAIAFFSPDAPHAFINFDYNQSDWVTPEALAANGLLAICLAGDALCLEAVDRLKTREIRGAEITLSHKAWGHVAAPYHYVVTVIPPEF